MLQTRYFKMTAPILALLLATSCASQTAHRPSPPDPAVVAANPGVKAVSAAGNDFGFRLLHWLAADTPTGNIFFAPFSVSQALTLTMTGAGGQTRADMAKTLGLSALTPGQINDANALRLPSLENPEPKVELSVANALWANVGIKFAPQFQADAKRFYGAEATTLNFGDPSGAAAINSWVSTNTQGKITEIVSQGAVAHASAVLTNAVYFHGLWQSPFDKAATADAPFYLAGKQTKTVPLMSQESSFDYLQTPQFQAVRLPYGKGRLSMLVFLPASGTTADSFAATLNSQSLNQWQGAMKPTELTLFLPRFKANYSVTLNKPLSALGMGSAFGGADFGPMGLSGVHISAVLHKAVLDVDEKGTTAAAATAVVMTASAHPSPLTTMRVDRPFVCVLRDSVTGAILFAGIIREP